MTSTGKRPLVIFGTGVFAEVADYLFRLDTDYEVVAFTVDRDHMREPTFAGRPVVPIEQLVESHPPESCDVFVAVGYKHVNRLRADLVNRVAKMGYRLATYLSPRATTFPDLVIGENSFIFEDNTIQPFVRIGRNVVVWSGNHIGHHATIGDHCFITSHVVISGSVHVGPYSFLGVNATLRDNIHIGGSNVIGAGAIIMRSTKDGEVYVPRRTEPDPRKSDEIGM